MSKNGSNALFTVLVIAYDRREFILNAVYSALSQIKDGFEFEVIVVKNYSDHEIDHELEKLGVQNVVTDKLSLGEKLTIGTFLSNGEYICILEDDDQFTADKLSYLRKLASMDALYIHHGRKEVYSNQFSTDNIIEDQDFKGTFEFKSPTFFNFIKMRRLGLDFNCSSIVIRKDLIVKNESFIKLFTYHLDTVLFMLALAERGKIVELSRPLTLFRIHDNTLDNSTSMEQFTKERTKKMSFFLNEKLLLYEQLQEKLPKIFLLCDNLRIKSMLRILGMENKNTRPDFYEFFYGILPKPPFKTYLFDLEILLGTTLFKRTRERLLKRMYKKAILRIETASN